MEAYSTRMDCSILIAGTSGSGIAVVVVEPRVVAVVVGLAFAVGQGTAVGQPSTAALPYTVLAVAVPAIAAAGIANTLLQK